METTEISRAQPSPPPIKKDKVLLDEKNYFPSGAIAFFVVLVLLGLVIWFGIYFLMLDRI